ncbi:acetyl-CoA carboxyl transferase [Mumia zhuanghuii]|uniref:Acetyl-CoA carboxyl transferase n=1 Tax=Mumia zhuanghuii TaxID=2585211 RepID=A0A5Q6S2N3_9ACTN|nr:MULTISPECIES: carboxyl transferase domain-containing protein [Mumia]KAA1424637.1 acetyl-CoA carboxyl transferase [Mumia zhuanghuii]
MSTRLGGQALIDLVLDTGSFHSWDVPVVRGAVDEAYAADLTRAAERAGTDEAVLTGEGTIRGRRVAVLVGEFGFLAGSIGVDAAERLTVAIERATAEGLPLLAAPVSGGTRMQEGTPAFVRMVQITAAICAHKDAGLPYLVYLRNPTTGGVMASWGSLGHITVAEPGALLGFLGPRVYEALYGEAFPEGVQTAENLYAHGIVDAVLPPEELADIVDRALRVLQTPRPAAGPPAEQAPQAEQTPVPPSDPWESVVASRREERPGVRALLRHGAGDVVPLNGTGQGEAGHGLVLALVRFGEAPAVLLGQDRREQTTVRPLGPDALREARRGMRLAAELGLPLVSVIDTPGAALSVDAEQGGLAGEIARSLADMVTLRVPTLTVLLGQGTGGGALALLPADRVVAAEHAWLSPLPPEGASAIVHRTPDRAAEMARAQRVGAAALTDDGVVDRVVAESPDAADEPEAFCRRVGAVVEEELATLCAIDDGARRAARRARFRHGLAAPR